jgi:3-phosphoshikimate 1-carboxyvinyltransferase
MRQLVVRRSGPLRGTVSVPGDKSISHRALLLSALADGDTAISGWLAAEDCQATLRCIRALGVEIEQPGVTDLLVHGVGLRGLREPADVLNCGGSGTTMRLLVGILAGQPFLSVLTGTDALRRRPMARVAEPLRQMGAKVLGRQGGRLPPLAVQGGALHGFEYSMPVASAQVKSALLLAGLFAEGETVIHEPGPARDHTERMLRSFGLDVRVDGATICLVGGQSLRTPRGAQAHGQISVPADYSSAAFPLIAAILVPGSIVQVSGVCVNSTRTGLSDLLAGMGACLTTVSRRADQPAVDDGTGEPVADLLAQACALTATTVGGDLVVRAIDEFPIFTIAATQALGMTTLRDATELRVKETDRIGAVAQELAKMGARIDEQPDGMLIHGPARLHGAVVDCHHDHRLAMALAVAGLVADGQTVVQDAGFIDDSFPGFVETMQALGADIRWA